MHARHRDRLFLRGTSVYVQHEPLLRGGGLCLLWHSRQGSRGPALFALAVKLHLGSALYLRRC